MNDTEATAIALAANMNAAIDIVTVLTRAGTIRPSLARRIMRRLGEPLLSPDIAGMVEKRAKILTGYPPRKGKYRG